MEEINALNTTMTIIKMPGGETIYWHKFPFEKYLDVRTALEKEGQPFTSEFVIKRIISELPELFPDFRYKSHSFLEKDSLEVIFNFTAK